MRLEIGGWDLARGWVVVAKQQVHEGRPGTNTGGGKGRAEGSKPEGVRIERVARYLLLVLRESGLLLRRRKLAGALELGEEQLLLLAKPL